MSRKQQATDKVNKKKRITKIPFSTANSKGEVHKNWSQTLSTNKTSEKITNCHTPNSAQRFSEDPRKYSVHQIVFTIYPAVNHHLNSRE